MMPRRRLSYALVAIQLSLLVYLALSGPWFARGWLLLLEMAGAGLGLWAVATMQLGKFNITPEVRPDARLVDRGPYRRIRHPMYTSLLLIGLALVLHEPSPLRWAALALLAVDLLIKLYYEETLLVAALPGYPSYQSRTKRLIPYLY